MFKFISIYGFLLVSLGLSAENSQSARNLKNHTTTKNQENPLGQLAFDGAMTPTQIIAELYADKVNNEEGTLKVEITVPVVMDKKVMIKDTSGLPSLHNEAGEIADKSIITVPFSLSSDLSKNTDEKFYELLDSMDTVLEKLKVRSDSQSNNKNATNLPNCGGFPLGSTITDTWSRGWPFCRSISTTFSCLRVNGANNWYITHQVESILPCEFEP